MTPTTIPDKLKTRKGVAFVAVMAQLVRMEAPWQAFVCLAVGYCLAEAIQQAAEKLANRKG